MKCGRFVLLTTVTFIFLSGCATNHGDRFDNVIKENTKKLPAFNQEEKVPPYDASFIVNGKGGCIKGAVPPCPYEQEAKYLKDQWPPKRGLALSGGGTRAASFSIGVMKALNEAEMLDGMDLISSVSGGSYANYWYFSQQFYIARLLKNSPQFYKDIFKTWDEMDTNLADPNEYKFQRTLEESSEILGYAHKPSFTKDLKVGLQYGVEVLIQGLSIPLHWIANGLFDWEINVTPYYYFYKDGIDRSYGYVPLDYTLDHFANATYGFFSLVRNIDAEPILLRDVKDFLIKQQSSGKKLPYFVINTAARYGNRMDADGINKERTMEASLFEFTPWGCHSELMKFHPSSTSPLDCPLKDIHLEFNRPIRESELDLARIVTASGAAVDGQVQFVDISGREEEAYQIPGTRETLLELGLDIANLDLGYTSQNQHTDSWKRAFHKLLPWPLYLVHDYVLQDEATSVHLSDGGHSENLGILPLIRRGTEQIIAVDSEYDPNSVFESAKRLSQALKRHGLFIKPCKPKPVKLTPIDVHDLENGLSDAVTDWEIARIDKIPLEKPIRITYIKLAAPSRYEQSNSTQDKLPYSVISYLRENHDFPHESTLDITYSSEQFRAYRDLGYAITTRHFPPKNEVTNGVK